MARYGLHRPAAQSCWGLQAWPQEPQCAGSVARSTQAPPQLAWVGRAQVAAQLPSEQTCPGAQAFPQAPQFCGSLSVRTQRLPQSEVPTSWQTHAPN